MTVIAGYVDEARVAIGSDTNAQTSVLKFEGGPKLYKLGRCWVGSAGASLWLDFLQERQAELDKPQNALNENPRWQLYKPTYWGLPFCRELAQQWLAWAKERGHGAVEEASWYVDGSLLVASPQGLFCVDCTGSVRQAQRYHAIGTGAEVAMGALCSWSDQDVPAEWIAETAVKAAIRHAPGCGGQVNLHTVELAPPEESS